MRSVDAGHIVVLLQSLEGGGAQRRLVDLMNGFAAGGRRVDLILIECLGELHSQLHSLVNVVDLSRTPSSRSDIVVAISNHLQTFHPDVLLSGSAAVHPLAIEALPRPRAIPLILRADSHPHRTIPWSLTRQRLLEPIRRHLRMRQYAAADLVISVSEDVGAVIRKAIPGTPVVTILNPVISDAFLASAEQTIELPWPDKPETTLIVGIGRLAMAKDFPTLIRAFAHLRKSRLVRLAILGQGWDHERAALLRLARQLDVEADFALPGVTNRIAAWLKRADAFVSSSLWEGSAGALIEALAIGCPIVATDCVGSARDLLTDESLGILVPPRRPKIMAEAIATQLDRNHEALVPLRRAAARPYWVEHQASEYLAAIDRCLDRFRRK